MQTREFTKFLIYHFTAEEMAQLSAHLVRNTQDLETVQDRKKQVMADFTAKIKAAEAEIFKAARLIGNGYEYRDVKCTAVYDEPRKGMKRVIRTDTGEVVGEEAMSGEEMQYMLELDVEATREEVKHEDNPAEEATSEQSSEVQPAPEPAPGPQLVAEPESDDDEPFGDEPFVPAEPVRITAAKQDWCAQIVILDTPAGFLSEASIQFKGGDLITIETPGAHLSEQECRTAAARKIWAHARHLDLNPGARRKALRAIMAWANDQMIVPSEDGDAN